MAPHETLYHVELIAGLAAHPDLEAPRQNRQTLQTPLLVLLAVSIRRRQLRQVPERSGDGPTLTHQRTPLPPVPPQGTRNVPPDRRLLGDYKPHKRSIRTPGAIAIRNPPTPHPPRRVPTRISRPTKSHRRSPKTNVGALRDVGAVSEPPSFCESGGADMRWEK